MTSTAISVQEREADLRVTRREDVAEGVVALTLADPSGAALPEWTPGAHVDLVLDNSLVRQYSLCSSPTEATTWRIGVLLDPESRGGSRFVHENLEKDSLVTVRGPRNHFQLVDAPSYQFIAGGIGITPMLPMIEAADTRGAEWTLLYGGRSTGSMAFLDELAGFGERVMVRPQDEHGLLDLEAALGQPKPDTLVYCCGPEPLLGAVEEACAAWPTGSLHLERFAAKPASSEQPAGALEGFEVECRQSGISVTVGADQSIIDALEDAGVAVLASCGEGVCGTCEAMVLEGDPDHRDSLLTDEERESGKVMMICVSRSRSERLVLDL
jgi:ferredoxin-NADP reductase